LVLFAVVAVPVCAAVARAADWPEFRGPTGQGHVADSAPLPVEWGPDRNIVWKTVVPGGGWSSPILLGGRIYLTTAVPAGADRSLRTLCLNAADGKVVWDVEVFKQDGARAPKIHAKNSHASPTPVTDGKRLFVHFGHQGTACLDLDGKVVWRNNDFPYKPVHGAGGSPILVDDRLVFSIDAADMQAVVALGRADGKVKWKTDRRTNAGRKFSFCTPLLIEVNGKRQIVSPGSGLVGGYDPETGAEVWRVRYGEGYSVVPRPVYAGGLLYVCTGYDSPKLLAIRPDGTGDVTDTHVAWTAAKGVPHNPSLLAAGDGLYMVSDRGVASCLDLNSGAVKWQERLGGNHSASPILADGKIYFVSEEGSATVIKAGPKFEKLAVNDMRERTLASMAAADGALYLRTDKHLYRIGAKP
jgi:outer membrane protein assembly factor BamB